MNVLRGQNRLVLGGSLHWIFHLFEKKFVAGYQFMKVERNGADTVYRIDWKDVVLILENPIVKTLKIR